MSENSEHNEPEEPFELIPAENPSSEETELQEKAPEETAPEKVPEKEEEEPRHDSIYEEEKNVQLPHNGLAEINFDLLDAGRFLLKVVSGPNNGAEFSMEAGRSYLIGTDPNSCDIVFQDTSVSRQHARITVSEEESLTLEDLKSRNGTLVDGKALTAPTPLTTNNLITVGTTSFVVYDREGNMQTLISPLLPEIVKVLQKDTEGSVEAGSKAPSEQVTGEAASVPLSDKLKEKQKEKHTSALIAIVMLTGLFVLIAIGTTTLFKSEPIELVDTSGAEQSLKAALEPFKDVKYSYNKATGRLLLIGHVLTMADREQLLNNLSGMPFIKSIDDAGVVIDELVWRNTNEILNKNPEWRGITIQSPTAGQFVLTGYLQTEKQAESLYNYLASNFPYLDRLDRALVVDENIVQNVTHQLAAKDIRSVTVQFINGELLLTGGVPASKQDIYLDLQNQFKKIPGVRQVRSQVSNLVTDQSTQNISDRYEVSGYSKQGNLINVIINGRIVTRGDTIDGMTIKSIAPNTIILEKDGVSYRIDYNSNL